MFSWIVGYKNPCDEELKTEVKSEEVKTETIPVIEGKKDTIIRWRDYDTDIQKIKEELRQLKIESDERWNKRLSPVSDTELTTRKKRKKNKNASDNQK